MLGLADWETIPDGVRTRGQMTTQHVVAKSTARVLQEETRCTAQTSPAHCHLSLKFQSSHSLLGDSIRRPGRRALETRKLDATGGRDSLPGHASHWVRDSTPDPVVPVA